MIYGSVCSGIEAASVAWKPLGWRCAFTSEIGKFQSEVLRLRHPEAPNLGDMTTLLNHPEAHRHVVPTGWAFYNTGEMCWGCRWDSPLAFMLYEPNPSLALVKKES